MAGMRPKKSPVTKIVGGIAKAVAKKSSKEIITGRKLGKPKPTAGKGIYKNIITTGGKKGRALENKMRSEMKMPKGTTAGKAKSIAREKKFGTPSHKQAKQTDSFVNQFAKSVKKSGRTENPAQVAPKSVSVGVKKVPAKKKGK